MSWTETQLIEFCNEKGIPRSSYGLSGDKDEAFCLVKAGNEWLLYYSERGTRNELAWAKSESQALNILKLFLLEAHSAF